jgi:hypothetical protein
MTVNCLTNVLSPWHTFVPFLFCSDDIQVFVEVYMQCFYWSMPSNVYFICKDDIKLCACYFSIVVGFELKIEDPFASYRLWSWKQGILLQWCDGVMVVYFNVGCCRMLHVGRLRCWIIIFSENHEKQSSLGG